MVQVHSALHSHYLGYHSDLIGLSENTKSKSSKLQMAWNSPHNPLGEMTALLLLVRKLAVPRVNVKAKSLSEPLGPRN